MLISFKGTKIFYEFVGHGECITFLCGWGYGSEILKPLATNLHNFKCLFVDFPCFGKSECVRKTWTLDDYCDLIFCILQQENITLTKIIAHSFGGKVAIRLQAKYNIVESLVLIASAGIKPRTNLLRTFKIWHYKLKKHLKLNTSNMGSSDYRALPDIAKKTFVNIVNTYIEKDCCKVKCPCLIFAGDSDDATPLYMQKKLHRLLENSIIVVLKAEHYVWLDGNLAIVRQKVGEFLRKKEKTS